MNIFYESKSFGSIPCKVRRSHRTSRINVRIKHDHLSATIPYGIAASKVREVINENSEQIELVLSEHRKREKTFFLQEPAQIKNGCQIPFQGKMLPLKISFKAVRTPVFKFCGEHIELFCRPLNSPAYQKTLRKNLVGFYYSTLKSELPAIISKYEILLNVEVKRVTIKTQRSRWGSCSCKGNININWRLALTPPAVLEAVTAHELCHLTHPNHSKKFHNLLASVFPSLPQTDEWFRAHGSGIMRLFSEF